MNAQLEVIIFCKSHPSNWQLKRIWLIEEDLTTGVTELNIGTKENRNNWCKALQWVKSFTLSSDFNQCRCLQFRFLYQLLMNFSIRNVTLRCLENLVCAAVWIPVWMYAKWQGCEWNISVLKNSLKIGFEFKESTPHVEPCLESWKSPFW